MQAGRIFNRAHTLERVALGLLNSMPLGVVLVSRHGSVIDANRLAREILAAGDILSSSSGGLTLKLATGRVRVRDLLNNAVQPASSDGADIQGYSAPREAGRQPVTVLVVRLKQEHGFPPQGADAPVAALFIGDPERPTEVDLRRLIRLYGLSRAEARVAALLARGQRLDQIAETLGLTYETVRKHVKQIFSKTGTDRQAELVRTIVTGPCGLRF
jgi:DNA-binding CsgD family transcriptional regulator